MERSRIIIADDSEMVRDFIEVLLVQKLPPNFFYNHVSSGQELEKILGDSSSDIALAITDNHMPPGPTGSELTTRYSKKVKFPIILYYHSLRSERWIGEKALRDGAAAVFFKDRYDQVVKKAGELLASS